MSIGRIISVVLLLLFTSVAQASHFRGGTFTSASVNAANIFTGTMVTTWRKNGGDSSVSIRVYDATDTTRSTRLLSSSFLNPVTDNSDPAYSLHTANISINLSGLATGNYIIRYQYCCRIAGISNVGDGPFAIEAFVRRDGTVNNAPIVNSSPFSRIAIGQAFSQNINASDPDGDNPLSYAFLNSTTPPDYAAPAIPNLNLDSATGQLTMSAANTALFTNNSNHVAKIRITDSSGAYTDRDIMFNPITTSNVAPTIDAIPGGNPQTVNAGQTLSFTITARDVDATQLVSLTALGLPANATFSVNPAANPVTATFTFTPAATQVGQTFGINFDARDNDAIFPLVANVNFRVSVNAPVSSIPTLSEWMLIILSISLALIGYVYSRSELKKN